MTGIVTQEIGPTEARQKASTSSGGSAFHIETCGDSGYAWYRSAHKETPEIQFPKKQEQQEVTSSSTEEAKKIICAHQKFRQRTLAYLKYKREPEMRKILGFAEDLRDTLGTESAAMNVSLLKETLRKLWNYSPEVDANFAKIITLLEDALHGKKWSALTKGQVNSLIAVIKICVKDSITDEDRRRAFRISYHNNIDTFPELED